MAQPGRPEAALELTQDERATLQRWARRPESLQALALRSRIVLACADGLSNTVVAEQLGVHEVTVGKWCARFVEHRLEGLSDKPRPATATYWSTRSMVEATGTSQSVVARISRAFGLKPHRQEVFTLSTGPQLVDKVRDVVGLYLSPLETALVLCVDEKTQVQVLNRSAPVLPMMPGTPERVTHDYIRAVTLDLFAALAVAGPTAGQVITGIRSRHRAVEFGKFLIAIDNAVPADLDVHLICDNLSTHKTRTVKRWLLAHPRFHVHFIPAGACWLSLVERWFAEITVKLIRRGVHHSVKHLADDIAQWADNWNANPKPYVWTKTADEILESLTTYCVVPQRSARGGGLALSTDQSRL
jgi:transposase